MTLPERAAADQVIAAEIKQCVVDLNELLQKANDHGLEVSLGVRVPSNINGVDLIVASVTIQRPL